jgi:hypothetical protein
LNDTFWTNHSTFYTSYDHIFRHDFAVRIQQQQQHHHQSTRELLTSSLAQFFFRCREQVGGSKGGGGTRSLANKTKQRGWSLLTHSLTYSFTGTYKYRSFFSLARSFTQHLATLLFESVYEYRLVVLLPPPV